MVLPLLRLLPRSSVSCGILSVSYTLTPRPASPLCPCVPFGGLPVPSFALPLPSPGTLPVFASAVAAWPRSPPLVHAPPPLKHTPGWCEVHLRCRSGGNFVPSLRCCRPRARRSSPLRSAAILSCLLLPLHFERHPWYLLFVLLLLGAFVRVLWPSDIVRPYLFLWAWSSGLSPDCAAVLALSYSLPRLVVMSRPSRGFVSAFHFVSVVRVL